MRRPVTITGMLLHLARGRASRSPRAVALAVALAGASLVSVAALHTSCPARREVQHRTMHAQVAGGTCVASGAFCVNDLTCGRGDRCADPRDVMGTLARAMGPGTRDDALPISPTVAWNGEGWAIAWSAIEDESAEIFFARATASGQRIGAPVRLTRSSSLKVLPSLAASPDGYAVTWTDVGEDAVSTWVLRLDKAGAPRGAAARLSGAQGLGIASRVVWNGHDYALAWYNATSAQDLALRFARVGADGNRVGEERTKADRIMPTGRFDFGSMGAG